MAVTLITPEENNKGIIGEYIHWESLRSDIDLKLYHPEMSHLKVMLIDDKYLLAGSANFDYLSYARQKEGFLKLAGAYPDALIQCPVDFLAPLIISIPDKSKEILDLFRSWGVNLFSVNWMTPDKHRLFDQMDSWGFKVNIYNLPDLEAFLQATLLVPASITSDFNFPPWHYFGHGSGELSKHYQYQLEKRCSPNRRNKVHDS